MAASNCVHFFLKFLAPSPFISRRFIAKQRQPKSNFGRRFSGQNSKNE
jgi:hypothetical protein